MPLPAVALLFALLLVIAYRFYGRFIARRLALDDGRPTPAHTHADGVDYVPTRPFYLFGQHFAAIAAAGPIAGPILAAQQFGWLPCLLWIGFGVVGIGAVHDFTALTASVRHGARSIADIARERLGTPAGRAVSGFIWLALLYVIVAFADITAGTFVTGPSELAAERSFHPGGAVAAASILYLLLAVTMGLCQRYLKLKLWLLTLIFVPLTFGAAWLGTHISQVFLLDARAWALLILIYCAVASVTPMWLLLQPRGYLGGFVLYTSLALGFVGILFGGYDIVQPAFKTWDTGSATLFPFLFVTIACGACSGFHGLVCSGTTSKQIDRESHLRPVGYGGMLAEGLVALIALTTFMIAAPDTVKGLAAGTIYGNGIGRFMTLLLGEEHLAFAVTFGAMVFSTFVFDTLDVATRLGRYVVQELFGRSSRLAGVSATVGTLAVPALLLAFAESGAWLKFWTVFGASNQLLAALTLIVLTSWLTQTGRRSWFVLLPMFFVLTMTLWALGKFTYVQLKAARGLGIDSLNALIAAALVGLALFVAGAAIRRRALRS